MAKILHARFGDRYPVPARTLPKWVVWLFGPIADQRVSRRGISRNVGYPWIGDHSKSVRELGMSYRPLEDTLTEMFQQLIDAGVLNRKGRA